MTATLAFQIGGAFLLAALVMAGPGARSLVSPQTMRLLKITAMIIAAILLGMAGVSRLPDLYSTLRSAFSGAEPASASPVKAAPIPGAPAKARTPKPTGEEYILYRAPEQTDAAPAAEIATPAAPVEPAPVPAVADSEEPQPAGNRGKRALKSVGRFLHLGHKSP